MSQIKIANLSNNVSMEYIDIGKGEKTYLLLHGLGSSLKAFNKLIPELKEHARVLAVNYPQDVEVYSLRIYADMIAEFIQSEKIESLAIIGHSMGSQIAVHLTLKHPKLVNKLVLIAPAGIETFSAENRNWFGRYVTKEYYKTFTPERIKYNFDVNFYGSQLPEDAYFMYEDRMEIVNDESAYDSYLDYYLGCIWAMLNEPVFDELQSIDKPVMVIFGADDLLIPNRIIHPGMTTRQILDTAASQFKNCSSHLLEDCGHFAVWDKATEIGELIKTFN